MPPTGDIVRRHPRDDGLRRTRARATRERIRSEARSGRSPALEGIDEPMLDYLLGSDQ